MEILNHRVMRQATYSLQKTPEHVLPSSSSLPLHTKRYIYYERIFKGRINYLTKHRGGWRGEGGGDNKTTAGGNSKQKRELGLACVN